MTEAIFFSDDVIEVDASAIEDLLVRAGDSPRGRFRLCLHHSQQDPVQEMIIACRRGAYIRPHRHPHGKSESYHLIQGEMTVFIFDDAGKVVRRIEMGADSGKTFVYRLANNLWHLPVPRSEFVVYHEVYTGPFEKEADVQYAAWSPDEEDISSVEQFLNQLDAS